MNTQPRTVAEVDALIQRGQHPSEWKISPFERRFAHVSPTHQQLLHIKQIYGSHPTVDQSYNNRRANQKASSAAPPHIYRLGYERVLSEISQGQGHVFDNGRVHRFLDLGFSPGGFSNWLLNNNPRASGVGITLSDTEAGYVYAPDDASALGDPNRFTPIFDNIIAFTQNSLSNGTNPIHSVIPGNGNAPEFDLVVAGAFPTMEGKLPWYHRVQLALSQLYIVLFNLQNNGSAMFVINTKPFVWQVEVLAILKNCFRSVETAKGSIHKTRTSCYVVCKGFQRSNPSETTFISQYLRSLRATLLTLAQISAAQIDVDPEDSMPSISGRSADDIFNAEGRFILDLFQPRWKEQYDAIHEELKKVLESGHTGAGNSARGANRDSGMDWRNPRPTGGQSTGVPSRKPGFDFGRSAGGSNSRNWR
ncbi:hypothetical protein QCA50_004863 [Cerrena zonata]|uniref:Ribosomal RNA methyltransferase FtsJ domain-containing protein n=1 Tax=Cerrena zonata TaxID=2478898 RepID=A0AAW0GPF7_9APHY